MRPKIYELVWCHKLSNIQQDAKIIWRKDIFHIRSIILMIYSFQLLYNSVFLLIFIAYHFLWYRFYHIIKFDFLRSSHTYAMTKNFQFLIIYHLNRKDWCWKGRQMISFPLFYCVRWTIIYRTFTFLRRDKDTQTLTHRSVTRICGQYS